MSQQTWISAGDLDRRITIQALTIVRDSFGSANPVWVGLYANIPAKVTPSQGRERFHTDSERIIAYRVSEFLIRHIGGITQGGNRIVYKGENWNILDVSEVERHVGLLIVAQIAK